MKGTKKIDISLIDNFTNHPYQVKEDESFNELLESIQNYGLLNPLIVRKKENGRYELISGHRRKLALEKFGIEIVDVDIRDLSDEDAIILMVDSNMHRDKILPSEKAFAYKMKYDAMKHQGKKTFGTECQKSRDKIAETSSDSSRQIHNYIRLTNLIPELLQLVDDTVLKDKRTTMTMGIKPAVELSYLSEENQNLVYAGMTYNELTPSHDQAKRIRQLSEKNKLEYNILENILIELKGNQKEAIVKLKLLGYVSMVAESSGCILSRQYKQIAMQLAEAINLIASWKKSDDERWKNKK